MRLPPFLLTVLLFPLAGVLHSQEPQPIPEPPKSSTTLPPATPIPQPLPIADFDMDKSGDVSEDEFLAYHAERMGKLFGMLDVDKNGKLSEVELSRIRPRATRTLALPPGPVPPAPPAPGTPPAPGASGNPPGTPNAPKP